MKRNDKIEALECCEAIRRRPAMYVGDLTQGLQRLVHELIKSAVEPQFANNCSVLQVNLHSDSSLSIVDDGSGISVAPQRPPADNNAPWVEDVLTLLGVGQPDCEAYRRLSFLWNINSNCSALSAKKLADERKNLV